MPDSFVVFATEEGGLYQIRRATQDDYDKAVGLQCWVDENPFYESSTFSLTYIAFCPVVEDFDFVAGDSRVAPSER